MNIEFNISYPLADGILSTGYDTKLEKKLKEVSKLYSKHEKAINKALEQATGLHSKREKLSVWLLSGTYETCPRPALVNPYDTDARALFEITYVIAHTLLFENDKYDAYATEYGIDEVRLEATVYTIALFAVKGVLKEKDYLKLREELRCGGFKQYIIDHVLAYEKKNNLSKKAFAYGK